MALFVSKIPFRTFVIPLGCVSGVSLIPFTQPFKQPVFCALQRFAPTLRSTFTSVSLYKVGVIGTTINCLSESNWHFYIILNQDIWKVVLMLVVRTCYVEWSDWLPQYVSDFHHCCLIDSHLLQTQSGPELFEYHPSGMDMSKV